MSIQPSRGSLGSASMRGRDAAMSSSTSDQGDPARSSGGAIASHDLIRSLAEVKGQAQFLLYLADQIEESLEQLSGEADACHGAFLCKILGMYSGQLESKHQGLGDKIAETCQEVYVTVREYDAV
jgi:hypothetical protein